MDARSLIITGSKNMWIGRKLERSKYVCGRTKEV